MFFATTSARATAEDAEAPSVDSLLTFNMPSRNRTKGLESALEVLESANPHSR